MKISEFFKQNRDAIAFAIAVIVLGTAAYFALSGTAVMTGGKASDAGLVFEGARLKVAFSDAGMKVFVLAKNNELAKLKAAEGKPIPEPGTVVIGGTEAAMMKKEKLFSAPGDLLSDFFGINTTVGGVLGNTGTFVDEVHFLSERQFELLNATEGRMFVKFTAEGAPKIFYRLSPASGLPANLSLAEGSMEYYEIHRIAGREYYPVIVGATEAKMMREEKLFSKTGDRLEGFFGQDVLIAGVLNTSGTPADMVHFTPLAESDLN
jgi:hypothetical protein